MRIAWARSRSSATTGAVERNGSAMRLAALDRDGRDHRAVLDGDDQATGGRVGLGVQAGEAVEIRGVGEGRVAELQLAALLAAPGVAGLLADRALALVRERGGEGGVAEHCSTSTAAPPSLFRAVASRRSCRCAAGCGRP